MKNYVVQIDWFYESETIYLNNLNSMKPGDILKTFALWEDYPEEIEYVTVIDEHETIADGRHLLKLRYDQSMNSGSALDNKMWGTTTLELDLAKSKAKATWNTSPPWQEADGPAHARLLAQELRNSSANEKETYSRYKRNQDQFKKELLKYGARCALTGETTLQALEAAHIIEVKDGGAFGPSNGILLRADIHKLFDAGVLKIQNNGSVSISASSNISSFYSSEAESWRLSPGVLARISSALKIRNSKKSPKSR